MSDKLPAVADCPKRLLLKPPTSWQLVGHRAVSGSRSARHFSSAVAVAFDRAQTRVQFFRNGALDGQQNVTFPTGAVDQTDLVFIAKDGTSAKFL